MAQGGPNVARALAAAPGIPPTFHPAKLIIRIMFRPGIACAIAKKVGELLVCHPAVGDDDEVADIRQDRLETAEADRR
jgi:hypothetical protein